MKYEAEKAWTRIYSSTSMAYPSEYLIRIFKGAYPNHVFDKSSYENARILDVSCGDGRDLAMLRGCGFKDIHATEITQEIVDEVRRNLKPLGFDASLIQIGQNHNLPYPDSHFDYLISWNACYYMQQNDFEQYVDEFARVCASKAWLVLSIPKKSCFIYRDSHDIGNGYRIIRDDYFQGLRNGEKMRCFNDTDEIEAAFSTHFTNFRFASIHDDCFGLNYHWHLAVCQKK